MAKRIVLRTFAPEACRIMCIAPIGQFCNVDLQKAKYGDTIWIDAEGRVLKYKLLRKCLFRTESKEFWFTFFSVYGERFSLEDFFARWERDNVLNGLGRGAFSRDEVLFLELSDE